MVFLVVLFEPLGTTCKEKKEECKGGEHAFGTTLFKTFFLIN
jgi:hypothetical protein